jgi:hypothetical protein
VKQNGRKCTQGNWAVPELSRSSLERKGQILRSLSYTLLSIFESGTFQIRRRAATSSTGMFVVCTYRGADKSLARPTSRCILFDGKNISFDASLVIYINSTNILPIMVINRIYEHQNLLLL